MRTVINIQAKSDVIFGITIKIPDNFWWQSPYIFITFSSYQHCYLSILFTKCKICFNTLTSVINNSLKAENRAM